MSNSTTPTAPHYFTPTVSTECEVSISQFSRSQIEGYLAHLDKNPRRAIQGYEDGLHIDGADLARIATLSLCGQRDEARQHLLRLVGDQIGRAL